MSRVANALSMYILLQGRRLMTVSELAEILKVSPRMIKSYKKDLCDAGIQVSSKSGRYGGYYLENTIDLKGMNISKEELNSLKMAREVIRSGSYLFAKDFEKLANKIMNLERDFGNINYFGKEMLKPSHMKHKEREVWNLISEGIVNKKKVQLSYSALKDKGSERISKDRVVHPYGTFEYEGSAYFYGYCEMRVEVRYFKLSRIESITILKDRFTINNKYDIRKMLEKSFGIFDDEIFYLKLKITYPISQLVKERQYSIDQKITEIDDDTIIFEARLKGYQEVKTWVLGMGSKVEVIEPDKLKEDIKMEGEKLIKLY